MIFQKKVKKIGISIVLLCCFSQVQAQQDPQYTQYMYNTSVINPAYAGSRGVFSVFGMYRTQWVGIDGAPKTANVSMNTPLGESGLGLGVNFINDKIGAMSENTISVDLAYGIELNTNFKLAFGVKGTANLLDVDYTKLNIYNPSDPATQENINNKFTPNLGAGIYLYSDKSYLGFSVPNFLTKDRYNDNEVATMRQKATYNFMGGHVFDLSPSLQLKPAFLLKAIQGTPLQVDLTANFLIVEKFTLGAAYRWDASVSALAGFQITNDLFIGYAYDAETTKLARYNSGSHEVFLRFELSKRNSRVNTPRFF